MGALFDLNPLLGQLITLCPVLLVYVIGMALAVRNWQRYPAVGLLVLCGTGVLFASTVGGTFVIQFIVRMHGEWGWQPERMNTVFMAIGFLSSVLHAVGIALLLAAAFSGRNRFDVELDG